MIGNGRARTISACTTTTAPPRFGRSESRVAREHCRGVALVQPFTESQLRGIKRPWTADEDNRLRRFIAAGYSRHAIAVTLRRAEHTVQARAEAIQLPLTTRPKRRVRTWMAELDV